jgi:hypothetical protein
MFAANRAIGIFRVNVRRAVLRTALGIGQWPVPELCSQGYLEDLQQRHQRGREVLAERKKNVVDSDAA